MKAKWSIPSRAYHLVHRLSVASVHLSKPYAKSESAYTIESQLNDLRAPRDLREAIEVLRCNQGN